jgi:cyclase
VSRFRVIARIDVKNEFVVKGKQMDGLRKLGDPNQFALRYYEADIDELLFVDVVAAYYGRKSLLDIVEKARANIFIPVTVGGGIRRLSDIEDLFRAGADKVAINTASIHRIEFLTEAVKVFGSQSVVSSIESGTSQGKRFAFYDNGRENSGIEVLDWVKAVQDCGVGEILLTSVDRDGMKSGLDSDLIESVSQICDVPLIVGGGFSKIEHLSCFRKIRCPDAIAIASALHYEMITISEIKEHLENL